MVVKLRATCLLALALLPLLTSALPASASEPSYAYGFVVEVELEEPLRLVGVYTLSEDLVLGVATDGQRDYIVVLRIRSPHDPVEVVQVYPVLGRVTHVSTNGWPIERIAVGTSVGEVLVFRLGNGRLYKLLDLLLGVDFFVKKVLVMRTHALSYVYAALVDEAGPSQHCVSCSVYLFSELREGLVRVGLSPGNATLSVEGLMVSDVAARKVFGEGYVYFDASYFIVVAVERPKLIRIDVNVTYYDHASQEHKPASGVLLWVYAYGQGKGYTFFVNADASGRAAVYVEKGMTAVISALDMAGRNWTISVDTSLLPDHVDTLSASITMYYSPLTTPASGTPPYMLARVIVYNATDVPSSVSERGRVKVQQPPGVLADLQVSYYSKGVSVVRAEGMVHDALAYYDPDTRSIVLWRLLDGNPPTAVSFVRDYVGGSGALRELLAVPGGRHVICVTEDARVRVYEVKGRASEAYALTELLRAGSTLMDSSLIGGSRKALYVETPEGVHLFTLGYPMRPILRQGLSLGYPHQGAIDADTSYDGETLIVLLDGRRLQVFRNLGAAHGEEPVRLEDLVAGHLRVSVIARREDVGLLRVGVETPWGPVILSLDENGEAVFRNLLPNVTYIIRLLPQAPYISYVEDTLVVPQFGNYSVSITAPYVSYPIRIRLVDPFSITPVAPLDVYVDGLLASEFVKGGVAELVLLHGPHTISVKPSKGYEHVYESTELEVTVTGEEGYDVVLARKSYVASIRVVDELTRNILGPVYAVVKGEGVTLERLLKPGDQTITGVLPYGEYVIELHPTGEAVKVYKTVTRPFTLQGDLLIEIPIPRKEYEVRIRPIDPVFGVLAGHFDLYVNGTPYLRNLTGEASLRLPYGVYTFQLVPTEPYRQAYEPSKNLTIAVVEDTELQVRVLRRVYSVEVKVEESPGRPLEGAEVFFYSGEAGKVVATAITDAEGRARVTLPYGRYVTVVSREGYLEGSQPVFIEADSTLTIALKPTLKTAVLRTLRLALPYIATAVAVILGALGALRLRRTIRRRLETEEVF